jgi:transcriptional regulator with XRE-family HTH domain
MSQERLAEVCGCDRSYLSFVERGLSSPTVSTVFLLAKALDVKASYLITEVEAELDIGNLTSSP